MKTLVSLVAGAALAAVASVHGAPVIYYGIDPGAGPANPRPNSDAARASWTTAASSLGSVAIIDFESNANSTLAASAILDSNTTVARTGGFTTMGIMDDPNIVTWGYNTTSGGNRQLTAAPLIGVGETVTLKFDFATPVQAWGSFFTGVGTVTSALRVNFVGGGFQEFNIAGAANGGILFWGFTDAGQLISSISVVMENNSNLDSDVFSLDDMGYVVIPLPHTGGLAVAGLIGLGALRRRRH